jgi:hypothetical protein
LARIIGAGGVFDFIFALGVFSFEK